ncbi:protein serine/threonine phosphatase 2C [Clavulina sp. PMI_390]|nr:protein serine/threonine phosphatase 2C [Clavulina sp. PMI_390]
MLRPGAAPLFSDSPNARSKTITTASGPYTHGILNQHPATPFGYSIGVAEDTGSRRTMEDAHSFVADFAGVRGQGYFAVFDGHAGKHAAEWCGEHFHEELIQSLASSKSRTTSVPDVLNRTFHAVDARLSKLAEDGQTHSGCTAVTAFLRLEDDEGNQPPEYVETALDTSSTATSHTVTAADVPSSSASVTTSSTSTKHGVAAFKGATRRVLYTANAGDARAVLGRGGRAVRLTYDHKGSDAQEAKRIKEAGGFVMNNRVNGVLAVTRSLGDSAMKEFVVGSPYTTETLLGDEDDVLIIACDGLWDVIEDQAAIDLIRPIITSGSPTSAQEAASKLVRYALDHFSSDNISVLVVKLEGGWR